jgi:hypothetical protein
MPQFRPKLNSNVTVNHQFCLKNKIYITRSHQDIRHVLFLSMWTESVVRHSNAKESTRPISAPIRTKQPWSIRCEMALRHFFFIIQRNIVPNCRSSTSLRANISAPSLLDHCYSPVKALSGWHNLVQYIYLFTY